MQEVMLQKHFENQSKNSWVGLGFCLNAGYV